MPRPELPTGTVTFLFTDIEGSTRLLHELGGERYADALTEHRRTIRQAFDLHGGVEVDTQGDAFFVAFPTANGALAAARDAQAELASGPIKIRMGIHTGTPIVSDEGYVGADVHKAARIAAAGHGGQVLLSAATAALVDRDGLVDLGDHRLKDLAAPERIYQLGEGNFPRLKTLYQTNLPIPLTPFLGRATELAQINERLRRRDVRVLTLTGPGGTGKTRLALQATADAADDFPDGVFWVPLTPLSDANLVLETAAKSVGAEGELAGWIADKRLLLLFDNFEHLVDAATDVAALVSRCPNLKTLVTSRELLQLPGEHVYPVPPLAPVEGIELFTTRAQAVTPDFEATDAVAQLCQRLDNLPLAIELAAARVRMLTPEQLLARLGQRLDLLKGGRATDPRQQTLRATIEWSYDLLSADEQRLFARLAAFRGGWTLEAAEVICDADLDVLQSLVDKSLVRLRDERFTMLETIREFAAAKLEMSGEADDLRRRHGEMFAALADEAAPHLGATGSDLKLWLDRLEADHDNLRAALDWFDLNGEAESEQRLTAAMWRFWQRRGHYVEAKRLLQRSMEASSQPTEALAGTTFGAAILIFDGGDRAAGSQLLARARQMFEQFGDAFGIARVDMNLGVVALEEGDHSAAREMFEEARRRFEALGEDGWVVVAMRFLAWAHWEIGDINAARALHEEIVPRARALGNVHLAAMSLGALGEYAAVEGRTREAAQLLEESTRIFAELRDPELVAMNVCRFARALSLSRAEVSAKLLTRGVSEYVEIGRAIDPWLVKFNDETRALISQRLSDAQVAQAQEAGLKLTMDQAVALALEELATLTA